MGSVLSDELHDDPLATDETVDQIMQLKENTELKLEAFYNQMIYEATGKGKTGAVPICNVVSKVQSVYASKVDDMFNTFTDTIEKVVDDAFQGEWKSCITKLISGGLGSFFGPSEIETSGKTAETKIYNVVWTNNAMTRLDVFVTQTSVNHKVSEKLDKAEKFGGYIMVVSVVDFTKINWQVFLFEFSKFFNLMKLEDNRAAEIARQNLEETAVLIAYAKKLFDDAANAIKEEKEEEESR